MKDRYTVGSAEEWLKHSNDELARVIKKKNWQMAFLQLLVLLLASALLWVIYRYGQHRPIQELWPF